MIQPIALLLLVFLLVAYGETHDNNTEEGQRTKYRSGNKQQYIDQWSEFDSDQPSEKYVNQWIDWS